MQYLGGESRLGKKIAAILSPMLEGGAPYYEPFCGACNVAMHIKAGAAIYQTHTRSLLPCGRRCRMAGCRQTP